MSRPVPSTRWLVFCLWTAACGGGGGGGGPTEPGPPSPTLNVASFEVTGSGQSVMAGYDSSRNTVFCSRNAGWASLWIRLGRDAAANGDNGPHLDLDLCNHAGGGAFGAHDPQLASCGGSKTFDLFWHPGDGAVFSNRAAAGGCTLQVTASGERLSGTFQCTGLEERNSSRRVDVLNGSFQCTETT